MFTSSRARPTSTELVTLLALIVAILIALSLSSWGLGAPGPVPAGVPNPHPSAASAVGLVTRDLATGGETPVSLVRALVGPDAVISNIQYTGAPIAAGTFTGGTGIIGFESGVILSSGDVASVPGPNQDAGTTTDNQRPGDPDLSAIIGFDTRDASILEFDVQCLSGAQFSFEYVFSSEEYYENLFISDVFACMLNGQNIALIPGTNSPVSVTTVNCDQPYNPPSGPNCSSFVLNTGNLDTEMDGLTVVLTASGVLHGGQNHIKLAIADCNDGEYDANVFLRSVQPLDCSDPGPVFEAPSPCSQTLFGYLGVPMSFQVQASAANGLPGASATLNVSGDAVPLAGGTFVPPLPAGPAQPVSTQFQWTPTGSEWGNHHLIFTATDQLQWVNSCDVFLHISSNPPPDPIFPGPSVCGQTVEFRAGSPFSFAVAARAENSMTDQAVVLSVSGDAIPLAGGTFFPPLPAGPAQPVSTRFEWSALQSEVGTYHLQFTATDQLGSTATCDVTIEVVPSPGVDLCQPGTGTVIACPCSNPPVDAPRGCENSSHTGGAQVISTGIASIGQDTLVFTTNGERPTTLSILVQGDALLPQGTVYGQGVRCVGGLLKRLYVKTASGGSITVPEAGDPSISVRSAERGDTITAGTSRFYLVYYRDPWIQGGCPFSSTLNSTQTQEVPWAP